MPSDINMEYKGHKIYAFYDEWHGWHIQVDDRYILKLPSSLAWTRYKREVVAAIKKYIDGKNPGRKHLTGHVSAKAQRAYEHIRDSLSGPRRKEIAARTVRKMIREGKINNPRGSQYTERYLDYNDSRSKPVTPGTYLGYELRGRAKGYMGGYKQALVNDLNRRSDVVKVSSAGGGIAWVRDTHSRVGFHNPSEALEISEGFHGRKVQEDIEIEEKEKFDEEQAVLGCLVELCVTRDSGETGITLHFETTKGDEVYVCAPNRHQITFVGGDQEIVNLGEISKYSDKQYVMLGCVESIVYLTDKHHLVDSNGKKEEYEHKFGKKKMFGKGKKGRPELEYDTLNCKMRLVGGSYTVEDEGITN